MKNYAYTKTVEKRGFRNALVAVVAAGFVFGAALFFFFAEAATVVVDDAFADGSSTNQNLAANSLAVYKARSTTVRADAVGSVTYDMTATTGAEAFWAYFTNSGAPVALGVGDSITFSGTFSVQGLVGGGQDIRFGLFNSNGSRQAADLTGGHNAANFADDTGYGAQFYPSGTGSPFALYRKDASPTTNIFNSMNPTGGTPAVATGWSPLAGTGANARQLLQNNTPYTFTYAVSRLSATETRVTVAVTGGTLSNLNYTATESGASPYTGFDWFGFRVARSTTASSNFADRMTFTRFKVEYAPAAPAITTQPAPAAQTVAAGANVQYSVGASGNALAYQWYKDGAPITGNASATTATLQLTNVLPADSGAYTVTVTNSGGSVTSNAVNLTVTTGPTDPIPVINQQPADTTATVGSSASLSVGASGLNLTYQWFKNGAIIGGANSATLSFASVQPSDTATYTVTVSNSGGTVTSNPARLTVVSTIAATAFAPQNGAVGICTDAPLAVTFNQTPKIGTSGTIKIYTAGGALVETIDLANAAPTRTIGTNPTAYRYYPVIVTGNTAAIYPKQQLAYNQTFYVTIDTGALTDQNNLPFAGFSDSNAFRFTTKPSAPAAGTQNLAVAADNAGDFCTVQGAIDFIPANNAARKIITVKNGVYTEIVYVGATKPFVTVRGETRTGAVVQYANNNNLNGAITGNNRASFGVDAADFNLENITLRNTTAQGGSQAETLRANGGRTVVNSVNLLSFQDTLLTQKSAYITNSYIEGDVDFMWGNGATYFKDTELKSLRDGGYYTQIRNTSANYGNVYVNCRFTKGAGVTSGNYLGRIDPDDFPFSQVVLIDSKMDSHIAPAGWLFNNPTNALTAANYPNIRYWEANTTRLDGTTPVDCSQRHPLSRNDCNNPLTQTEIEFYRNAANVTGFAPQDKLTAIVALSNLNQVYDGAPKTPTVTTDPANLPVTITYNGSTAAPTNAGTYTVVATVNDANYAGTATATLTIARAAATVALGNLTQNYDGAPKAVSVTTNPANLATTVTYNGSTTPPTAVGNYTVVATVSDPNYNGSATGVLNVKATIKAFPEAEGAGAYAVGGRGGDVYRVTNLNDAGAGSLRHGIQTATGARTIVFDVSGTIYLNSQLNINKSFLTIAGQTAPGDGITVAGFTTVVTNAQHVIVRYVRFRPGDINCPTMQGDSFWVDKSRDVMVDHVSASWSVDESLSVTESDRVSVQWSMIAESLNNSCHLNDPGTGFERHGYGSLIRYGSGRISFHHNLFAHHFNRNPRVGDNITLDFVNNVIYDWGTDASYSGPASEGTTRINYVGNYLVAGPNTPAAKRTRAFNGGSVNTLIYQTGNHIDGNLNGVRDGADTGWAMFTGLYTQQTAEFRQLAPNALEIIPEAAPTAYNRVLNLSGSSRKRDAVDQRIAANVTNETGAFINSQTEVGGFPALASQPAPTDTDGDGIPDSWETSYGLNPNNPSDAATFAPNGYTYLENFLNGALAPTAADANIGGRVRTAAGRGIANVRVTLRDGATGEARTVKTNPAGFYSFGAIAAGRFYIVTAESKRFTFGNPVQTLTVVGEVVDLDFTANE